MMATDRPVIKERSDSDANSETESETIGGEKIATRWVNMIVLPTDAMLCIVIQSSPGRFEDI